jgi:hypothetical protein
MAEHPDDVLTASYLDGSLDPQSRDRFEAHLSQCDLCRDGVTLLRSAGDAAPEVPAELLRRARGAPARRGGFPRGGWLLGLAASLLVVVALAVLRFGSNAPEGPSPVRGEAPAFTGLSPSNGAQVPATRLVFIWSPVDGADRYELSLFDAAGRKVGQVTARREATSAPWPEDASPPAPGSYVWKIRAMALDRMISESEPMAFEVGP